MTINPRTVLLAAAFAATAAAALAGLTIRGETRETTLEQTCARTAWPNIPAECLEGSDGRPVRHAMVRSVVDKDMNERFALAFQ